MESKKMRSAEVTNGRAAMLGCSFIALIAVTTKTTILESLQSLDLQSIWLAIGVYAS